MTNDATQAATIVVAGLAAAGYRSSGLCFASVGLRRSHFGIQSARHARFHSIASSKRTNGRRDLCVSRNSARYASNAPGRPCRSISRRMREMYSAA